MKALVIKTHKEFLKTDCYVDDEGDWWRHEEDFLNWKSDNAVDFERAIVKNSLGKVMYSSSHEFDDIAHRRWAVGKHLTEDINPEYFV